MAKKPITITKKKVQPFYWVGISKGAARLGVSASQLRRHIDGSQPSKRLEALMRRKGVSVAGGEETA